MNDWAAAASLPRQPNLEIFTAGIGRDQAGEQAQAQRHADVVREVEAGGILRLIAIGGA